MDQWKRKWLMASGILRVTKNATISSMLFKDNLPRRWTVPRNPLKAIPQPNQNWTWFDFPLGRIGGIWRLRSRSTECIS